MQSISKFTLARSISTARRIVNISIINVNSKYIIIVIIININSKYIIIVTIININSKYIIININSVNK